MTKKSLDQNMYYREELLNSIEPNFIFSKKPLNRFKNQETRRIKKNLNKREDIEELKKLINSIQNCNLKNNSQNLILGDGNINSPIMIVGEAPGAEKETTIINFLRQSKKPVSVKDLQKKVWGYNANLETSLSMEI